tara:strand:- start:35790 stop:36752 length:963 start_codon:yes stop_codon:yes gene_type:complete
MLDIDLSLNRVYWEYAQTKSYMRPLKGYYGHEFIPSLGVYVTAPHYKKHSKTIREDYFYIVENFVKKYKDYEFVLGLSGGIDSEVCAETFYQLGIPFTALSLRLFNGKNDFDLVYAAKYCVDRKIKHKVIPLSFDKLVEQVLPKAVKYGQFTNSISQVALTYLFEFIKPNQILINSGHNPDFHPEIGLGWWEDSPNYVKYAINTKNKFITFTSLEPIFCHYAKNHDLTQPGEKDNTFLYASYDNLPERIKRTGWENSNRLMIEGTDLLREECRLAYQSFITWKNLTVNYKQKLEKQLDKSLKDRKDWEMYKLLSGAKWLT